MNVVVVPLCSTRNAILTFPAAKLVVIIESTNCGCVRRTVIVISSSVLCLQLQWGIIEIKSTGLASLWDLYCDSFLLILHGMVVTSGGEWSNPRLAETPRSYFKIRARDARKVKSKPCKNETSRIIKNAFEISRSCQNIPRPTFFEVPFATPVTGPCHPR